MSQSNYNTFNLSTSSTVAHVIVPEAHPWITHVSQFNPDIPRHQVTNLINTVRTTIPSLFGDPLRGIRGPIRTLRTPAPGLANDAHPFSNGRADAPSPPPCQSLLFVNRRLSLEYDVSYSMNVNGAMFYPGRLEHLVPLYLKENKAPQPVDFFDPSVVSADVRPAQRPLTTPEELGQSDSQGAFFEGGALKEKHFRRGFRENRKKRSHRELTPSEQRIVAKFISNPRFHPSSPQALKRHFCTLQREKNKPKVIEYANVALTPEVPNRDTTLLIAPITRPVSAPPFIPTVLHRPVDRVADVISEKDVPTTAAHMARRNSEASVTPQIRSQHDENTDEPHAHIDVTSKHTDDGGSKTMPPSHAARSASRFENKNIERQRRSICVSPESRAPTPAVPDFLDAILATGGVMIPARGVTLTPIRYANVQSADKVFANAGPLGADPLHGPSERSAELPPKRVSVHLNTLVGTPLLTATTKLFIYVVRRGDRYRLTIITRDTACPMQRTQQVPTVFAPHAERDMKAYQALWRKSVTACLQPYGPQGPQRNSHSQDFSLRKGREFRVFVKFPGSMKTKIGVACQWVDMNNHSAWRGHVSN